MLEYGRKPYITKNYREMMNTTPNRTVWNQLIEKHSEFEKPYLRGTNYDKMQFFHHIMPGLSPWRFDWPKWDLPFNPYNPAIWPGWEFDSVCDDLPSTTACYQPNDTICFSSTCPFNVIDVQAGAMQEAEWYFSQKQICLKTGDNPPSSMTITVVGSNGETGTINISPCIGGALCECTGETIGYTTDAMNGEESQSLTVENFIETCDYEWDVLSGCGSISGEGDEAEFTAGKYTDNVVITLSLPLSQGACDSLEIAVTGEVGELISEGQLDPYEGYGDGENWPLNQGDEWVNIFFDESGQAAAAYLSMQANQQPGYYVGAWGGFWSVNEELQWFAYGAAWAHGGKFYQFLEHHEPGSIVGTYADLYETPACLNV